jgi:hypothetical protein
MKIEARLAALEHLMIAAIIAVDAGDGRSLAATRRVAQPFKDFADRANPPGTGDHLEALLETLRAVGVAPPGRESSKKSVALHRLAPAN